MPNMRAFNEDPVDESGGDGGKAGKWGMVAKGDPFAPNDTPFSYDYYDSVTVSAKFPKKGAWCGEQYEEAGPHGPDQMAPKRKGAAGSSLQPSHAGTDAKDRPDTEDRR